MDNNTIEKYLKIKLDDVLPEKEVFNAGVRRAPRREANGNLYVKINPEIKISKDIDIFISEKNEDKLFLLKISFF